MASPVPAIAPNTMPAASMAPPPVTLHDVTVRTTKKLASARVMGIPPEEFGVEKGARSIHECNYCFHEVVTKSRAEWIAEGFDESQINSLTAYSGTTEIETTARDTVQEHMLSSNSLNKAAEYVKVTEHYVRMDYESSGRPSLYQIFTGADQGEILRKDGKECITPFDAIPIAATTPVPMTHRFFGRSIADLVMPLQREKTALKRGALDNLYLHNNPRVEVAEANAGANTLDDLLVSRPGGVVRTKTPGGLNWQTVPDITGSIYPMLQYIDAELETRTGVSKQAQGIDADALQNQSATAVAQVFSASQMRTKLIARIIAEGVRDMFALLHATIRKHGQQAQTVRLRNTWVQVDPRAWKTRDDMTINVGLGNGSKAQQFAQQMAIGNVQKELLQAGKVNLVGDTQLFHTAAELCKIMGHKNADKFFKDPDAVNPQTGQLLNPPPQPMPDPKVQIEQIKQQGKQQENAQKAQLEQQKQQSEAAKEAAQAQADIIVAQVKAAIDTKLAFLDHALKQAQAQQQHVHKEREHHMDMAGRVLDMAATAQAHDHAMKQSSERKDG